MNYNFKVRQEVEKKIISCGLTYIQVESVIKAFNEDLKEEYFKDPFVRDVAKTLIDCYKSGIKPTLEYVASNRGDMYKEMFDEDSNQTDSYNDYMFNLFSITNITANRYSFETDLFMLKEFVIIDYWNQRSNDIINGFWSNRDIFIVSDNIINGYNDLMKNLTSSYILDDDDESIESIKKTALKKLNERLSGEDTTIKIGHHKLDVHTGGFGGSEFILIGGRPGMGKTAFGLSIAKKMSIDSVRKGAYFTLEMSKEQLMNKYASNQFNIPYSSLKSYNVTKEQLDQVFKYYDYLEASALDIMFTSDLDKIISIVTNGNYEYVIIDYLQLITTDQKFQSREQEVSHISKNLKTLSRKCNIPVIALSQLKRIDGRPKLTDLRESGSLEQDADTVIFPYRPAYDAISPQAFEQGNVELLVVKCRSSGVADFYGHMDLTSYDILDHNIRSQQEWEEYLKFKGYK